MLAVRCELLLQDRRRSADFQHKYLLGQQGCENAQHASLSEHRAVVMSGFTYHQSTWQLYSATR